METTQMKYHLADGKTINARNPEEFVTKLRNSSYTESDDIYDFMTGLAWRAQEFGLEIRDDTVANFLEDLIKAELVFLSEPVWN